MQTEWAEWAEENTCHVLTRTRTAQHKTHTHTHHKNTQTHTHHHHHHHHPSSSSSSSSNWIRANLAVLDHDELVNVAVCTKDGSQPSLIRVRVETKDSQHPAWLGVVLTRQQQKCNAIRSCIKHPSVAFPLAHTYTHMYAAPTRCRCVALRGANGTGLRRPRGDRDRDLYRRPAPRPWLGRHDLRSRETLRLRLRLRL